MEQAGTAMTVGDGAVFVTVVCQDEIYAAGVIDTAAVANAVLSPDHIQLVNDGETIEIRLDVTDISQLVPQQHKDVIESGLMKYQKQVPALTLGRYVDISMFMKIGGNAGSVISCPTFLGICCFIWLAVILAVIIIVTLVLLRHRKREEPEGQR